MDIISWLADSPVKKVSSFAARSRFIPNSQAATHCGDCQLKDTCRYSHSNLSPYRIGPEYDDQELELPGEAENGDLCVFNSEKDVPDHQSVNLEFENGILATFTVCMDQPKTTRTIKINGTEGQIIGDIRENYLELRNHTKDGSQQYIKKQIEIVHDNSGHDGGNSVITNHFKNMLIDNQITPRAGLRDGIVAALIALAAEKSRCESSIVEMKELYSTVFGQ